jgi:hypothetical protein
MTGTRIAAAVASTLALAVPLAACGGDDADDFREDYNAAVERLTNINTEIGQAAGSAAGKSNAAVSKEFEKIADTAEKTRSDLSELDPPDDAQDELDKLLSALEGGIEDLRAVAEGVRANDTAATQTAVQALQKSGQAITEAEDALQKAVDG